MNIDLTTILVAAVICAGIGALICQSKDRSPWEGIALGGALGIIGLIIALFLKKQLPAAPAGMLAAKCPRCNAVQNVVSGQSEYECWQCHAPSLVPVAPTGPRMVKCRECGAIETVRAGATSQQCTSCDKPLTLQG